MTFEQYLDSTAPAPEAAEAAAYYVEGFNAADQRRIGIASLVKQQRAEDAIEADRLFRVTSGYDAVPNILASEFARRRRNSPAADAGATNRLEPRVGHGAGTDRRARGGKFMPGARSSPFPWASCRRAAFNSSRGRRKS